MKISEALGVSSAKLWKQGVFDSYLGIDSRLHIDPAFLRSTRVPEFRNSLAHFEKYFADVLLLLSKATPGGAIERQTIKRLVFPEISEAALGYSETSNKGRSVSLAMAKLLFATAKEIVNAGINDPATMGIRLPDQRLDGELRFPFWGGKNKRTRLGKIALIPMLRLLFR